MIELFRTIGELPDWQPDTARVHNKPFENAIALQLVADSAEELEYGIYLDGDIVTIRDATTDKLTGLSIHTASTILPEIHGNEFHILRDVVPDQTLDELEQVWRTHRNGYAVISYAVL